MTNEEVIKKCKEFYPEIPHNLPDEEILGYCAKNIQKLTELPKEELLPKEIESIDLLSQITELIK